MLMIRLRSFFSGSMTIQYDFESSVGYWVNIAAIAFRRALSEELAPHGITPRQMQVLGWLVLDGELSQAELAHRMDVEPPTLAGIIDRMESAGWVKRSCCREDRRKKLVRVGPAAEPVWEKIAACARRVRAEATAGLTEQQVSELRSMLRIVHENLSQQEAVRSDPQGVRG